MSEVPNIQNTRRLLVEIDVFEFILENICLLDYSLFVFRPNYMHRGPTDYQVLVCSAVWLYVRLGGWGLANPTFRLKAGCPAVVGVLT